MSRIRISIAVLMMCLFGSARVFAETQVGNTKTQQLLNVRTANDSAPDAAPPEGIIVNLDNTGVLDWTFLNPRRPVLVRQGGSVQFKNNTVDRTFSIVLPVSIKTTDVDFKYAVIYRPLAASAARRRVLETALGQHLTIEQASVINEIDRLMRVRELIVSRDVLDKIAEWEKLAGSHASVDMAALRTLIRKPHADRIAALKTRRDYLEARQRALSGSTASADYADVAAELETSYKLLGQRFGELAKETDPTKREALTTAVAATEARIVALRSRLAAAGLVGGGADEARAVEEELQYVLREFEVLEGDDAEINEALGRLEIRSYAPPAPAAESPSGSVQRVREALLVVAQSLDARLESLQTQRKQLLDTEVTSRRDTAIRQRRRPMMMFDRARAEAADETISAADSALVLLESLGKTGTTVSLSTRFGGAEIRGCAEDEGKFSCSAFRNVPPGGTVIFPWELLNAVGRVTLVFTVRFFDEAEEPANPTAYLTLVDNPPPPKNEFTWSLTGSVGSKRDPSLVQRPKPDATPNPIFGPGGVCEPFLLCVEGHKNRINGGARLDLKQKILNFVEATGSVQLREGDFGAREVLVSGGEPRDQIVTIPRFQFNVYSEIGLNLQFGRFSFAEPTNRIAVNESGEGFRVLFRNIGASYIVRRESNSGLAADRANRDSTVAILQLSNLPVSKAGPVRSVGLIALRGEDQILRDPAGSAVPVRKAPYRYETYGGELRYALPILHINGNTGGYWSRRDAREDSIICTLAGAPCNGSGSVWMATATRSFSIDTRNRSRRSITFSWAQGTGDNATTPDRDEGYIGERGAYTPDLIFLSSFVASFNAFERTASLPIDPTTIPAFGVGGSLSNKRHLSFKYIENGFSPLLVVARDWLGVSEADIAGYQTIVTYHDYRLRRSLADSDERDLGKELDIEFQIESPKGVKTFIRGGYYRPGEAVKPWLEDDVWTIATGVSVSI